MAINTSIPVSKLLYNGIEIPFIGGAAPVGEFKVQVIDYDGSIIDEKYLDTGSTYTLPEAPTHNGLTFQRYCASVEITDNKVVVEDDNILIGALYETTSGLSEFDVDLNEDTGFTVTLNMDGTKNWGDGTTDTETTHTYASRGAYTITCDGTTMTTSSSGGLFGNHYNQYTGGYTDYAVKNVRFSSRITSIGDYAFSSCSGLQTITIPYGVTYLGSQSFEYCYSINTIILPQGLNLDKYYIFRASGLSTIVIPYGCTMVGYECFRDTNLKETIIPKSVTVFETQCFYGCTQLQQIKFPESLTAMGQRAFENSSVLEKVEVPNNVTAFGNKCFSGTKIKEFKYPNALTQVPELFDYNFTINYLDFTEFTRVPTLLSTNYLPYRCKGYRIYVPDALYDQWITATNWSSLSSHIYKASERI